MSLQPKASKRRTPRRGVGLISFPQVPCIYRSQRLGRLTVAIQVYVTLRWYKDRLRLQANTFTAFYFRSRTRLRRRLDRRDHKAYCPKSNRGAGRRNVWRPSFQPVTAGESLATASARDTLSNRTSGAGPPTSSEYCFTAKRPFYTLNPGLGLRDGKPVLIYGTQGPASLRGRRMVHLRAPMTRVGDGVALLVESMWWLRSGSARHGRSGPIPRVRIYPHRTNPCPDPLSLWALYRHPLKTRAHLTQTTTVVMAGSYSNVWRLAFDALNCNDYT